MKIQRMPEDLVPLIEDLKHRITSLESKPLGTVYVNEVLVVNDPYTGNQTIIGDLTEYGEPRHGIKQWVNDTEPPGIPTTPYVQITPGVFSVIWDGAFVDDEPQAPDFSHLNVWGNNGQSTKLVGVLRTRDEVAIVTSESEDYDEEWVFWFTSLDQNGNESAPSESSAPVKLVPMVNAPDIQNAIDEIYSKIEEDFTKAMDSADGKNRVWHTPEPPVNDPDNPHRNGDMWFDTDNGNKIHIWNDEPVPGSWVPAVLDSEALDSRVIDIINEAKDQADTAIDTANGKNKAWHRPTPPPGSNHNIGDIWFKTDEDNKIHTWDGSNWVPAQGDVAQTVLDLIQEAKDQADTAIDTANGKNKAWHRPTPPPGSNHNIGDIWFKTDEDNKIHTWDGSNWVVASSTPDGVPQDVLDDILEAKDRADNAYTLANSKNRATDSINNPPANTSGYSAGDQWRKWTNLGTTGKLIQSWTVKGGAWVEDSMDPTYLPKVDIGEGTFGSLAGDRLTANTVSAEKLLIGTFDNVIADPLFTNNAGDWGAPTSRVTFDPTGGRSGGSSLKITSISSTNNGKYSKRFLVEDGDRFRVSVWVRGDTEIEVGQARILTNRWKSDGTSAGALTVASNTEVVPANTWYKITGTREVLPDSMEMVFGFFDAASRTSGSLWFAEASAIRMSGTTLIEDGAITTGKIATGAITAESGIIGSLDAGKITTGQMHGKYIEAGTIVANQLAIGEFDNIFNTAPFISGTPDGWEVDGSPVFSDWAKDSVTVTPGSVVGRIRNYGFYSVDAGDEISIRLPYRKHTATGSINLYARRTTSTGSETNTVVVPMTSTTQTTVETTYVIPSGTVGVMFYVHWNGGSSAFTIGVPMIRRMVGSTLIRGGAITTEKIASNAITAESGIIASLDAGKITTGQMHGKYIQANTILASQLVVMDFNNMLPNLTTQAEEWEMSGGTTIVSTTLNTAEKRRFSFPTTALAQAITKDLGVIAGDKIRIEFDTYATNASNNLELCWFGRDGTGASAGSGVLHKTTASAEKVSLVWEVPSTVASVRFSIRVPSGTPSNTVVTGAYNFTARKMTGSVLIQDGAVEASHIKTGTITAESGVIGSLDAGKITTGQMHGKYIEANTVSVDRILVGSTDNVIPDPDFTNEGNDWGTGSYYSYPATEGRSGKSALKIDAVGSQVGRYSARIPVSGGETFRVSVWVKSSANIPAGSMIGFFRNITTPTNSTPGNAVNFLRRPNGSIGNDAIPANTWSLLSAEVTLPDVISTVAFGFYVQSAYSAGTVWFSEASAFRMADGNLIVDGSILADHIHSDAIETRHVAANAIEADKIKAGAIRASHLAIGTGREIASNGSGQLGDNTGYEGFEYVARVSTIPVGHPGYFRSATGQKTTNFLDGTSILRIKPNTKYRVGVWVRASVAGSRTYLEPMVGSVTAGERPIPTYVFNNLEVPTTWTYWSGEIETTGAPSGTMYFRWFCNHANGTTENSIFYFTGFSVEEMVNGTVIQDGAITTDKIDANSITAEKLLIGTGSNIFPDPLFKDTEAWVHTTHRIISGGGRGTGNALRVFGNGGSTGVYHGSLTSLLNNRMVPGVAGRSYLVSVWVKSNNTVSASGVRIYGRIYEDGGSLNGAYSWMSPSAITGEGLLLSTGSAWRKISGVMTIPEGSSATNMVFGLYTLSGIPSGTNIDFTELSVSEMSSGELIVDGAIDGKTITGALLQTDTNPYKGLKMDNSGLRVYEEVLEGTPNEETQVSTEFRPDGLTKIGIYGTVGSEKEYIAGMDDTGSVMGQELTISGTSRLDGVVIMGGDPVDGHGSGDHGPVINSKDLLGASFVNHTNNLDINTDNMAWMTTLPFGMVSRGYRSIQAFTADQQEKAILEFSWEGLAGRAYKITVSPFGIYSNNGTYGYLNLYESTGTVRPSMASKHLYSTPFRFSQSGSSLFVLGGEYYYLASTTQKVNILFTLEAAGGRINVLDSGISHFRVWVEDMGLSARDSSSARNDVRSTGSTAPPIPPSDPDPVPPTKKTYTKTYNYSWHRNFNSNGSRYNSSSMDSKAVFGQSPYYTTGGTKRSHIGFSGNIAGDLSGATVKKVEVYVYTEHWHYGSGGTMNIGYHNNSSAPTSSAVASNNVVTWEAKSQKMKKPEGRWITLPNDSKWKAGTIKGIILRPPGNSSSSAYYGYAKPSSTKLRITYEK